MTAADFPRTLVTVVMTTSELGVNRARYFYDGPDPAQLMRVTNTIYEPREIQLVYDADGNLIIDEAGRTLKYDPLGRLIEVGTTGTGINYRYDPQDQLAGETRGGDQDQRFYRDGALANQLCGSQSSTFMRGDGYLLAEQQSDKALLLATDGSDSVLNEVHANGVDQRSYTAYGQADSEGTAVGRLGYNGELAERDTGWQMLGNGYRAYNPVLMRFHSPDSMSPFGEGGLNGYAYVEGDPVNSVDPTGHSPWGALIRLFRAPLSSTAKNIPKSLLKTKYGEATRLRRVRPEDVVRLEKHVTRQAEKSDAAFKKLQSAHDKLNRALADGRDTTTLANDYNTAQANYQSFDDLFKASEFAKNNVRQRVITPYARAVFKRSAKEFDIDEAVTAEQRRIARGNMLAKNKQIRDPKVQRSYLGDGNS